MYCSYLYKCRRRRRFLKYLYLIQDDQARQHLRVEVYAQKEED